MNRALVDKIVNALLYEGYILYPYRPSVKNRQRWTFGGLYPKSYCLAQGETDSWTMQTECLVHGRQGVILEVHVRFLHLLQRMIGQLTRPGAELPAQGEPEFRVVASLQIDGKQHFTWQEAVERTVSLEDCDLGKLQNQPQVQPFDFPACRTWEPLCSSTGEVLGVVVREQQAVQGRVEMSAEQVAEDLFKVRAKIMNDTVLEDAAQQSRDEALSRSLISMHTILGVREGEFVSLLDPPPAWQESAGKCRNEGTWPVLVGKPGVKDTMLSAPIILYDYPQVAQESPGDLFDATEIDEILTLRIMTLTDAEKEQAAALDDRVRALLQRTEGLAGKQLLGLHGLVRPLTPGSGEIYHE
jgi:hydrogenase maturation protease